MNTIKCPHCGIDVPQTNFCLNCGKKLVDISDSTPKNDIQMILCPNCNKNVPNTEFCIFCGNKIKLISLEQHEVKADDEKDPSTNLCPLCRNQIPTEHNFCHLCGAKIKKEEDDKEQSIICNRCWKPNPPNIGYCIHCGGLTLGKKPYRALILEQPFEGFQFDLSQIFKATTIPISAMRDNLSANNIPLKSAITHSSYFGIKPQKQKLNLLSRNLSGFDEKNIVNYLGIFALTLVIYIFWYTSRYRSFDLETDLFLELPFILFSVSILAILLLLPVLCSTFLVYRNSGNRLDFRLDSSRIFVTVIFNILWMFFGFGPILLRMGDFRAPHERIIRQKSFMRGIAWGSILTVISSAILAIVTILVIGWPGWFDGFIFKNDPIANHIIPVYFGAIWISLTLLIPLGDYYDKIIKRWNLVGYLILLGIGFLLLTHYFRIIEILSQPPLTSYF